MDWWTRAENVGPTWVVSRRCSSDSVNSIKHEVTRQLLSQSVVDLRKLMPCHLNVDSCYALLAVQCDEATPPEKKRV